MIFGRHCLKDGLERKGIYTCASTSSLRLLESLAQEASLFNSILGMDNAQAHAPSGHHVFSLLAQPGSAVPGCVPLECVPRTRPVHVPPQFLMRSYCILP